MSDAFTFHINTLRFDTNYRPAQNTRTTTNFANLARGEHREQNLRNTLKMIDNRFNALAHWDNPTGDRYGIELDIISAAIKLGSDIDALPLIEILHPTIVDRQHNRRIGGIAGNNFSSYVRDYDFSVVLREYNADKTGFSVPEDFGELHAKLFRSFINSSAYAKRFDKPPVICLSVSSNKVYHRTANHHPILGVEYEQNEYSLTDAYFRKMGLQVRYFMPKGSVAPLAFYFSGDLLSDYTMLELIATISVMETFQRIYRPEIYNANSAATQRYQPDLKYQDYSLTGVVYDREERSRLAVEQGEFVQKQFIDPHKDTIDQWAKTQLLEQVDA